MIDENEIDFDHITREQTFYLHRKLWNTIADRTLELKRPVIEREIFWLYNWPIIKNNCWCCEYCNSSYGFTYCLKCPIDWDEHGGYCNSIYSLYRSWKKRLDYCSHYPCLPSYCFEDLAKYAREIARLPDRNRKLPKNIYR